MAQRALKLPASYELGISPSGSYVASLGRKVILADLNTRRRLASWNPLSNPSHAAFSHCESLLSVKSTSGEIVVVNTDDGEILTRHKPTGHDEGTSLHYSACDAYLVDATWSGDLRVLRSTDLSIANRISFPGEMITEASPSADRTLWMFTHQPKTPSGQNFGPPPYITLWQWPLAVPVVRFSAGFDNLYAATLSPCSKFIAIVGYSQALASTELRILTTEGKVVRRISTSTGGTGCRIRLSSDSSLIGTITATGFSIMESMALTLNTNLEIKYPSDLAFVDNNASVIASTWETGLIVPLKCSDAESKIN